MTPASYGEPVVLQTFIGNLCASFSNFYLGGTQILIKSFAKLKQNGSDFCSEANTLDVWEWD